MMSEVRIQPLHKSARQRRPIGIIWGDLLYLNKTPMMIPITGETAVGF